MLVLTPPANATLVFESPGVGTTTDPATGNVVANVTSVEISASLTETPGNRANQNDQLGLDTTLREMRGYLLETPPGNPPYEGRVACTINNQQGTFHFTEINTPYRAEIVTDCGIPVQGSFQSEGGGR